jgi:hypothetical protein
LNIFDIKEIIFPYVEFKTNKFKLIKQEFEKLCLSETDKFEFVINHGIDITYALGGIHAAPNNVLIESDEDYIIKSLDVVSYYPNLAIRNGICAQHLPKDIFLNLYEGFFNERKGIPKSDPRNYILKILLNAAYGLSNDKYSFLKDRKLHMLDNLNNKRIFFLIYGLLSSSNIDYQRKNFKKQLKKYFILIFTKNSFLFKVKYTYLYLKALLLF